MMEMPEKGLAPLPKYVAPKLFVVEKVFEGEDADFGA